MTATNDYQFDARANPANGRHFVRKDGVVIGFAYQHNGGWYVNGVTKKFANRTVAKNFIIYRDRVKRGDATG